MIAKGTQLAIYVSDDKDKPLDAVGFKATGIFVVAGKPQRIELKPESASFRPNPNERTTMKYLIALTLAAVLGMGGVTYAQTHDTHGAKKAVSGNDTAATKAYRAANRKMHEGMNLKFSNDADVDFIRGMIPHHQGAIDMGKVVLQHGKDAQTRKWAEDIIREQVREIAEMKDWLAKHKKAQ